MGSLEYIGDYAFYGTRINKAPSFENVDRIGDYAFAYTKITSLDIPAKLVIGDSAFRECQSLESITIGNEVIIGDNAFRLDTDAVKLDITAPNNYTSSNYRNEAGRLVYYYVYLSPIRSLTIGDNVNIGSYAFKGMAEIETVTLGEGAVIGDGAFYNAASLKNIDLSKAVSIGASSFSGDVVYEFADQNMSEVQTTPDRDYSYRYYAPIFTSVDISGADKLGEDAFAYCRRLERVVLGDLDEIPARAFNLCVRLSDISFDSVKRIGENAFCEADLASIRLPIIEFIDKYAFVYNESLVSIELGAESVVLGEGAFSYCKALTTVENSKNITDFGAYSFAYTALHGIDATGAVRIGDHAFMKEKMTPFTVELGADLEALGENPFAFCALPLFEGTVSETFNGEAFEKATNTYDISENVKVIDGMLYCVVPNGLEFISYAGDATSVTVAEGTVRITASAFAGTPISQVVLPSTLASVGHKAFYGCEKLALVSFASYYAPVLEEEYDYAYWMSAENLPAKGTYQYKDGFTGENIEHKGLEIVPYFMWNATDSTSVIYYGANFVDYIGHAEGNVTMVRPSNGIGYGSFIFENYFSTVVDGSAAADQVTLEAIMAIKAIPEEITLEHKAIIEAARAAYERIASRTQVALVSDELYEKLTQAEQRIKDLEFLENNQDPSTDPDAPTTPPQTQQPAATAFKIDSTFIIIIALGSVAIVSLIFALVFGIKLAKKGKSTEPKGKKAKGNKKKGKTTEENTTEAAAEDKDAAETVEDTVEETTSEPDSTDKAEEDENA